ncbi:dihydroorotate dehydrogenase [Cryobacterium sp. TMT1-21]|uniref:Dihydroorotate dehydrogenase n=1 Tax=Cryobacterium shii TaxID=1259235 RepID=A0AAQ2HG92_9MICO|nr:MULTISPECIES: dihydroorotate dehydrogenase [Cryobacterium]TFC51313.1 dihydroorotate dehydrogenase [Cryobacterium shii]TFC83751.1 dihydroorotate dehydrogenase [Cryobacterium sp. TmT2-59]TFD15364.1 dihydroorotate dehydrogenase [Cryobacterium sp. TMT1-21]TFD20579.1 dihydroorotate dehydrogenase [Cryobacterium sp. TMT4-10]TFD20741.1 dihydroorotate dehydrogenase [Cryobacterium sp. TMT2-23]
MNLAPPDATTDARRAFFDARPASAAAVDLSVRIGGLTLANPVMPASGCFGPSLGRLIPVTELGAVVTKTVFGTPRGGNPAHRLTEIRAGMVNSVGIPSRGAAGYLAQQHPHYQALGVPTIISVGGHRPGEYARVVRDLAGSGVAYELNVSCPNLDRHGADIGSDPDAIREVVRTTRLETDKPLIVKLPVLVSSIADCALAAEEAGADAVCVANSIPALPLERYTRAPALGNVIGGLSGPGIRPIVLRLVWLASRAVQIPVIACGGIETVDDALDYFSVGATAIQVGTASFGRPFAMVEIVRALQDRCLTDGAGDINALIELWRAE